MERPQGLNSCKSAPTPATRTQRIIVSLAHGDRYVIQVSKATP